MKKILALLLAVALVFGLFISCATTPKPIIGAEGQPQPAWINTLPHDADFHYARGYANLSNKASSIRGATSNATDYISLWVETKVQLVIDNYLSDKGSGEDLQDFVGLESISRQTSKVSLSGVSQELFWVDDIGGVWILASLPLTLVTDSFEESMNPLVLNETALYADFKMNEQLEVLKEEMEKE